MYSIAFWPNLKSSAKIDKNNFNLNIFQNSIFRLYNLFLSFNWHKQTNMKVRTYSYMEVYIE